MINSTEKIDMTPIEMLVLLSGPIAVGKTSVRQELVSAHQFDYVRSSAYLKDLASTQDRTLRDQRTELQQLGDQLDLETDYKWVLDRVAYPGFLAYPMQKRWLVDAVRKKRQVEHFREAFGPRVFHVHLTAAEEVLRQRYEHRLAKEEDAISYDRAIDHDNERASRSLINCADLVLDTGSASPPAIAQMIFDGSLQLR